MSKSNFTLEYKSMLIRLRQARINAGLTQSEAAIKLGKHQSYISKIEIGERRLDVVELASLANIYNTPIDFMLADIQQPKPKKGNSTKSNQE